MLFWCVFFFFEICVLSFTLCICTIFTISQRKYQNECWRGSFSSTPILWYSHAQGKGQRISKKENKNSHRVTHSHFTGIFTIISKSNKPIRKIHSTITLKQDTSHHYHHQKCLLKHPSKLVTGDWSKLAVSSWSTKVNTLVN